MPTPMNRRGFLKTLGVGAIVLSGAAPARAVAQGDRLVVAVGQWGIETPSPGVAANRKKLSGTASMTR
jgi:hypothetical protein